MRNYKLTLDCTHLYFYDVHVQLSSDDTAYFDDFRLIYSRLLQQPAPSNGAKTLSVTVLTNAENHWGTPVLLVGDRVWRLEDPRRLQPYVYEKTLRTIATMVRSHILVHAGVVAYDGKATILVGDSQHGKTTLVLSLLQHGYQFMSDELAAINRADGLVHAFPRRLQVRSGSLELANLAGSERKWPIWLDKYLLDIDEIKLGAVSCVAMIDSVVLLDNVQAGPRAVSRTRLPQHPFQVMFDRLDDHLVVEIEKLEGIQTVAVLEDQELPTIEVVANNRHAAIAHVEQLCNQSGVLVCNVQKRAENRPDFAASAYLEPMPTSEMVMEMLRRFEGSHHSMLLRNVHAGSGASLFLELARLLQSVRCYRLVTGDHADMVNLVLGLKDISRA